MIPDLKKICSVLYSENPDEIPKLRESFKKLNSEARKIRQYYNPLFFNKFDVIVVFEVFMFHLIRSSSVVSSSSNNVSSLSIHFLSSIYIDNYLDRINLAKIIPRNFQMLFKQEISA